MGSKFQELLKNQKFKNFMKSPELIMLALVVVSILIVLASSKKPPMPDDRTVPAVTESSVEKSSDETTTSQTTTSSSTTTTTTSTETTTTTTSTETTTTTTETGSSASDADGNTSETEADADNNNQEQSGEGHTAGHPGSGQSLSPYINAGTSPNSDFYQSRLFVAGDSIAYGFNVYGLIPYEHNLAQESVSMWNLDYFTFCGGYGLVDAVASCSPELLYMSLGMNDVNMNDPNLYAGKYKSVVQDILSRCPNTVVVVAGITPIGYESSFTTNERIREYNFALENSIKSINSPKAKYFDAYSVVSDDSMYLRPDCSGGDGIHLQTHCYTDFLTALFNYLDSENAKELIEKGER